MNIAPALALYALLFVLFGKAVNFQKIVKPAIPWDYGLFCGAAGQIRTADLVITN